MAAPSANYPVSQLVAQEVAQELKNQCPLVAQSNKEWNSQFTQGVYKPGQVINLQLDYRQTVTRGMNVSGENIVYRNVPLQLADPINVCIQYDVINQKLATPIDTLRNLIKEAVNSQVSALEVDMMSYAQVNTWMFADNTGGLIDSTYKLELAGDRLYDNAVPDTDLMQVLQTRNYTALAQSTNGLLYQFANQDANEKVRQSNKLPRVGNFDVYRTQNVIFHTAGAAKNMNSIQVDGAVSSGTTINLKGLTANTTNAFLPGDRITFAGVYAINPKNYQDSSWEYTAVVTEAANSDGSGLCQITISQSINSNTDDPSRNLNAAIPNNTAVSALGDHYVNLAYKRRGMILVMPPMAEIDGAINSRYADKETGITSNVYMQGSISTLTNMMRISFLPGYTILPDYTCVNASSMPA